VFRNVQTTDHVDGSSEEELELLTSLAVVAKPCTGLPLLTAGVRTIYASQATKILPIVPFTPS